MITGTIDSVFEYESDGIPPIIFEPEYQAVLDRAAVIGAALPSYACQLLQNKLVQDLKAANAWNTYDIGYVLANDSIDPEFATINWISPTLFKCTRVNNPNYVIKKGFNSRVIINPGYLNTGWNVLNNAVKFNRITGAGIWHYVDDNMNTGSMIDYGVGQATSQRVTCQTGDASNQKQFSMVSSIVTTPVIDAISKGLWLNRRIGTANSQHSLWRDGVIFNSTGATSSAAHPNHNLCICCLNTTDTVFNNGSLRNVGMLFAGNSQAGLETPVTQAWYNYFNALQLL